MELLWLGGSNSWKLKKQQCARDSSIGPAPLGSRAGVALGHSDVEPTAKLCRAIRFVHGAMMERMEGRKRWHPSEEVSRVLKPWRMHELTNESSRNAGAMLETLHAYEA